MSGGQAEPPMMSSPEAASSVRQWLGRNAWRFVLLFAGVLLPLGVFAALADEVHELEALHFDAPLLWRMHGLHGPQLDAFVVFVTRLGYEWFLIPADIGLVLLLAARRRWRESVFAALALAGSALLNLGSKQFFQRDRPTLWESIAPESTYSFPSGHAMGSMTFACVIVLLAWSTRWRWPVAAAAVTFTVSVSLSRVYLGVHYPSDIIAGWCAALAWVVSCFLIMFGRRLPLQRKRAPVA